MSSCRSTAQHGIAVSMTTIVRLQHSYTLWSARTSAPSLLKTRLLSSFARSSFLRGSSSSGAGSGAGTVGASARIKLQTAQFTIHPLHEAPRASSAQIVMRTRMYGNLHTKGQLICPHLHRVHPYVLIVPPYSRYQPCYRVFLCPARQGLAVQLDWARLVPAFSGHPATT